MNHKIFQEVFVGSVVPILNVKIRNCGGNCHDRITYVYVKGNKMDLGGHRQVVAPINF